MKNFTDKLNWMNINELNTLWSCINALSQDFTDASDDETSEKLDNILDTIMEHIEYREAETEQVKAMEDAELNKYN